MSQMDKASVREIATKIGVTKTELDALLLILEDYPSADAPVFCSLMLTYIIIPKIEL